MGVLRYGPTSFRDYIRLTYLGLESFVVAIRGHDQITATK